MERMPSSLKRDLQVVTAKQLWHETAAAFTYRVRRAARHDVDGLDNRYVIAAISMNLLPAYRDMLFDMFPDAEFRQFAAFTEALRAVDRRLHPSRQASSSCPRHPTGSHSAAECRASKSTATERVKCHQCGKLGHYKSDCSASPAQRAREPRGNRIEISINGTPVQAIISNRTVRSVINKELAERLGIEASDTTIRLRSDLQTVSTHALTHPITIVACNRSVESTVAIAPLDCDDFILGADLMSEFHINIVLQPVSAAADERDDAHQVPRLPTQQGPCILRGATYA